jgi:hypothetical protein
MDPIRIPARPRAADLLISDVNHRVYLRIIRDRAIVTTQTIFPGGLSVRSMARRCPECYAELPADAVWVCPTCRYTLRIPGAAKAGVVIMVLGLALLGAFIQGPENLGLTSGALPTELATLTVANFPLIVVGTFALGALLALASALKIRREQARVAA